MNFYEKYKHKIFITKYTQLEKIALCVAFFLWGITAPIIGCVIIENFLGLDLNDNAPFKLDEAIYFVTLFVLYGVVSYPFFYYCSKFPVASILKLIGKK